MSLDRTLYRARHPVGSTRRLAHRLAQGPGLPVGRTARARRLLKRALDAPSRILVVGPPGAVRQAFPHAALDVVGHDPHDAAVTVVSRASEPGSLPRRWHLVVLTEIDCPAGRLEAAAGACLPGGAIAMLTATADPVPTLAGRAVEMVATARDLQLVLTRQAL